MAQERLALIEVVGRDGRVRQAADVRQWPVSIGRALDNDLVLDDPHVAPHHATLEADGDGRLWLVAGDTKNGVRAGRRTLRAGERLDLGGVAPTVHIGLARLHLRRAGEPLAPELPLAGLVTPRTLGWTLLASLVLWALWIAQHWVDTDPGTTLTDWLPVLVGLPGALALWCGVWALASKLFQHRFEFAAHWQHAVRWVLAITVAGLGLSAASAALGLPQVFRWIGVAEAALAAAWLYGHAKLVLPAHPRALAGSFGTAWVAGVAVMMALNVQRELPLVGPLYMHVLPQPALRLARPQSAQDFVAGAADLRETLDERAREDADAEEAPQAPEARKSATTPASGTAPQALMPPSTPIDAPLR